MSAFSTKSGFLSAAATTAHAGMHRAEEALASLRRCSAPGARAYEQSFGRLLSSLYRTIARDVAARTAGAAPRSILDIGAGPGGLVVALAARLPDAHFTIVDVDPAMTALALARMEREGLNTRTTVLVGDVASLPLPEASFDLVVSSFSVHHWPAAPDGFAEVGRVLRPGGRALIYDLPDWWGRWETGASPLLTAASAGGLTSATTHALPWPGPVPLVQRLEATR